MNKIALAIHGGAGTILRSSMTPELEREYREGLQNALEVGWRLLSADGNSLDAVERTVCALEDFPLFNAGRGSVFTHDGKNEMDASIMDGKTLKAGAIAFVQNIKHPISLARLVMERTEHVLLAAEGANQFATEMGVERVPDEYFFTEHRWKQLQDAIARGAVELDHTPEEPSGGTTENTDDTEPGGDRKSQIANRKSLGTVGAVACAQQGHLAAATSTGGMTNKKFGRVGDTALVGAGTYAEDTTCAVSCTGQGEFFMLGVTAYDVAARMKYKGVDLDTAANETLSRLTEIGGEGGFIAVDANGNVVLPFNCEGMYRGYITGESGVNVEVYR